MSQRAVRASPLRRRKGEEESAEGGRLPLQEIKNQTPSRFLASSPTTNSARKRRRSSANDSAAAKRRRAPDSQSSMDIGSEGNNAGDIKYGDEKEREDSSQEDIVVVMTQGSESPDLSIGYRTVERLYASQLTHSSGGRVPRFSLDDSDNSQSKSVASGGETAATNPDRTNTTPSPWSEPGAASTPMFVSGSGRTNPPPSAEQLAAARSRLEETALSSTHLEASSTGVVFTSGNGTALKKPSAEEIAAAKRRLKGEDDEHLPTPLNSSSGSLFTLGSGRAVPLPSADLMAEAKRFLEIESGTSTSPATPLAPASSSLFTSGNGKSIPPPSADRLAVAKRRLNGEVMTPAASVSSAGSSSFLFTSGKGTSIPPPSADKIAAAQRALDGSVGINSNATPASRAQLIHSSAAASVSTPGRGRVSPPPSITQSTASRARSSLAPPNSSTEVRSSATAPQPFRSGQYQPVPFKPLTSTPLKAMDTPSRSITTPAARRSGFVPPRPGNPANTSMSTTPVKLLMTPKAIATTTPLASNKATTANESTATREKLKSRKPPLSSLGRPASSPVEAWDRIMSAPDSVDLVRLTRINAYNAACVEFHSDTTFRIGSAPSEAQLVRVLREAFEEQSQTPSKDWILNHYRWIVWKRAAYRRSFPDAPFLFTFETIKSELKRRWEVERVSSSRQTNKSILMRVVQRDWPSTSAMVLMVSRIFNRHNADGSALVELADGWYGVRAVLDPLLASKLRDGRLVEGSKILVCGASLIGGNSENGVHPLELECNTVQCFGKGDESSMTTGSSQVRLQVSYNSSKPSPWDARLGLVPLGYSECMLKKLKDIRLGGGKVGLCKFIVKRCSFLLFREVLEDGTVAVRNEAEEESARLAYSETVSRHRSDVFVRLGGQLYSSQGGNQLSEKQLDEACEADPLFPKPRNVVTLLRLKIQCAVAPEGELDLTVWKPTGDLISKLSMEGTSVCTVSALHVLSQQSNRLGSIRLQAINDTRWLNFETLETPLFKRAVHDASLCTVPPNSTLDVAWLILVSTWTPTSVFAIHTYFEDTQARHQLVHLGGTRMPNLGNANNKSAPAVADVRDVEVARADTRLKIVQCQRTDSTAIQWHAAGVRRNDVGWRHFSEHRSALLRYWASHPELMQQWEEQAQRLLSTGGAVPSDDVCALPSSEAGPSAPSSPAFVPAFVFPVTLEALNLMQVGKTQVDLRIDRDGALRRALERTSVLDASSDSQPERGHWAKCCLEVRYVVATLPRQHLDVRVVSWADQANIPSAVQSIGFSKISPLAKSSQKCIQELRDKLGSADMDFGVVALKLRVVDRFDAKPPPSNEAPLRLGLPKKPL